jgi:hypothetical protein
MLKLPNPMTDHFRGRLEVFGLADLLQWMELNRRSGRLIITRGHDRRTLDWKEGEIVYVSGSLPATVWACISSAAARCRPRRSTSCSRAT